VGKSLGQVLERLAKMNGKALIDERRRKFLEMGRKGLAA
jgi:hypothetical protein